MTCILTGRGLEGWEWADAGRMFDTYTHTNSISHYLHRRKASQLFTRIPVEHMSNRVHCKRWFLDRCYTEIKYETLSDVSWITWGSYDAWKHFIVNFFTIFPRSDLWKVFLNSFLCIQNWSAMFTMQATPSCIWLSNADDFFTVCCAISAVA